MKTVAFVNHKGGVGKTACSLAFADCLARQGRKVVLADLDQQMNATQFAGYTDTDGMPTTYDMLMGERDAAETILDAPFGSILPGDVLVADAEADLSRLDTPLQMFKDALRSIEDDGYDYCVIDCPPSLGYVTRNAMVAADELIVVVQPDQASITGFGRIWEAFKRTQGNRHLNPDLKIAGVLINGYDYNRKLSRSTDAQLPEYVAEFGTQVYKTRIRHCEAFRQAQSKGKSLFDYAPTCHASKDMMAFVAEYEAQEGGAA